jgi:hypothetical protein
MIQRKSEEKKSHIQKELENLLPSKIMCLKNVPRSLRWRSTSNPFTTGTGLGANVGGRVVSECFKNSAYFFLLFSQTHFGLGAPCSPVNSRNIAAKEGLSHIFSFSTCVGRQAQHLCALPTEARQASASSALVRLSIEI